MFACSSKRALQLDERDHLLARLGGAHERRTIGLSSEVRYSVCLIASTPDPRAACSTNASTDVANES